MSQNILVYWHGIIGISGKGPNWVEKYEPNKTIGELIQTMTANNLGERNRRIEIFKFTPGRLDKWDKNDYYWNHNTKLSDYVQAMNGSIETKSDIMLVYLII